jgi:hypothetical protein
MAEIAAIAPIRPLDEAAALAWLRSQPGGRINLSAAELGRRWGWHRQRAGRRIKAWAKQGVVRQRGKIITAIAPQAVTNDGQRLQNAPEIRRSRSADGTTSVTSISRVPGPSLRSTKSAPHGTAPVTPIVTSKAGVDMAAYIAAVALAVAAAWFSIRGMVVLFPGSPISVIGMAIAMETAKLVAAGWLARRWIVAAWIWRLVLVALVAGLAVINATGVYAQLVAAHVGERSAATSAIETQDAALAARVEVATHAVADLDRRLGQIDVAIEEAAKRGRTKTALAAIEGQKKARAGLAGERNEAAGTLASLKAERASLAAKGRQIETEAAPIRYVAAIFGVADQETAIRWLILMMVLCCDPLAIALTAAASARRSAKA